MTYDKKTGTIDITSDDPKVFEKDLFAHFANVTEQIERDIASGKLQPKKLPGKVNNSPNLEKSSFPMKWFAVALNVLLLVVVSIMVLSNSPSSDKDWLLALLFFAAPIASLAAMFLSSQENLLSLYLRRKALEEKQRIKALEKQ